MKIISEGLFILLLCFCFLYLAGLIFPYISHKKVSHSFACAFQNREFYASSTGTERVAYINDNQKALLYRLRMIEDATDEIILSTFDFNADQAGKDILSSLYHAACRGVSVRIIVDGISGFLDLRKNPLFLATVSHPNIQIHIYNPIRFLKPWKFQARLHDKYLIIDKKMYLCGGRNTTNLFLGKYSSSQNIDRELFVYETKDSVDSSLYQLLHYFDQVWNHKDSKDYLCSRITSKVQLCQTELCTHYLSLQKKFPEIWIPFDWSALTFETNRITLLSNPVESKNKEPWMWYALYQLMSRGQQVFIYTPYIICGTEMYQELRQLTTSGIPIEIVTNDVASGANPCGCTDYLNQKRKIWNTGVTVYEFMGGHSCHTKAVLIDDRMSIIRSYNLDMRSTYQDTELMLAIDSHKLNQIVRAEFERDKTFSKTKVSQGYVFGKNYSPKKMPLSKTIFYAILRIVLFPFRRFL